MAVLQPCNADAPGAFALIEKAYSDPLGGEWIGWKNAVTNNYYVHETHQGLVLGTGERNGYDDSDFTVTVWNPEKRAPETFVYATTRYPTYHLYAHVDATEEVQAAATKHYAYAQRYATVMGKRQQSRRYADIARKVGCPMSAVRRLDQAPLTSPADRDRMMQIACSFKAGRLRSAFKKSLGERVVAWLMDPSPAYPSPLSKRQMECL